MASCPSIAEGMFKSYLKPLKPIDTGLSPKLSNGKDIKAVLFDIYGTLFISGSGDIGVAKDNSHKNFGFENLMKKFSITGSAETLLDRLLSKIKKTHEDLKEQGIDFPEVNIDRIWMELLDMDDMESARAFAMEYELIVNPVYPMPHLKRVMDTLSQKNISMGIISNAQFYTPCLFEWFLGKTPMELGFHPDLTIYSYQHNYAKPSRFLFTHASRKLAEMGIRTNSVLYIGNDMLNDIYAARSEGFATALFAGDKRSLRLREGDSRCQNITPDFIVTDLIQLTNFLP
jgi:putative hydrolase of the HAD superfamily